MIGGTFTPDDNQGPPVPLEISEQASFEAILAVRVEALPPCCHRRGCGLLACSCDGCDDFAIRSSLRPADPAGTMDP